MINLFTSYFKSDSILRDFELRYCLLKNSLNPFINKIFVLNEDIHISEKNDKIINIYSTRPSYVDFINLINLNSNSDDINIISNSDIYFDKSLSLINKIDMDNTCISLTRWDVNEDNINIFFNRIDSQDCWIFKGKIKESLINISNFYLGVPGCDNAFMFNLFKCEYWSINPSLDIKSFHVHNSKIRTSTKQNKIKNDYMYLDFCDIDQITKSKKRKNFYTKQIKK